MHMRRRTRTTLELSLLCGVALVQYSSLLTKTAADTMTLPVFVFFMMQPAKQSGSMYTAANQQINDGCPCEEHRHGRAAPVAMIAHVTRDDHA